MATSGTFNFALEIDDVIQEATEMIGGEQTLGHEQLLQDVLLI